MGRLIRIIGAILLALNLALIALNLNLFAQHYLGQDNGLVGNQKLLGGDFLAFYSGGLAFRENLAQLYDYDYQRKLQSELTQGIAVGSAFLPFVYPPLVAAGLAVLSHLNIRHAYFLWVGLGLSAAIASFFLLTSKQALSRKELLVLFICWLGFPPLLVECIVGGQIAWLGLLIVSLVYHLESKGHDFFAGVALSLSYYKPPLFVFLVLTLIARRKWTEFFGFFLSGVFLVVLTLLAVGFDGFLLYLKTASGYSVGSALGNGHVFVPYKWSGMLALLYAVVGDATAKMLLMSFVLVGAIFVAKRYWRYPNEVAQDSSHNLFFAWAVSTSLLLSLQVVVYDLALLLPALFLGLNYLRTHKSAPIFILGILLYFCFCLEFSLRDELQNLFGVFPSAVLLLSWTALLTWQVFMNSNKGFS